LVPPGRAVGEQERVRPRGAGDAAGREGVAVELAVPVARFGGDGPDDPWVARDQDRREPRDVEVAVVPAGTRFGIGPPEVGVEDADWLVVVPGVRERQARPARPWREDRHPRRPDVAG